MADFISFFGNNASLDGIPPKASVTPDLRRVTVSSYVTVPTPVAENVAFVMTISGEGFAAGRVPTLVSLVGSATVSVVPTSFTNRTIVANFGTNVEDGTYTVLVTFDDLVRVEAEDPLVVPNTLVTISGLVLAPLAPSAGTPFTATISGSGFINDRTVDHVYAVDEGTLAEVEGTITGSPTDVQIVASFAAGLAAATYHLRAEFSDVQADTTAFTITP